jgi:DNA-directed RNA polymerase specialized sigma24 family protein
MDDENATQGEDQDLRNELMTFAYRMLGSALDAELVAAQALAAGDDRAAAFEAVAARSSEALASRPPRSLPIASIADPESAAWLEPFPDDIFSSPPGAGEARFEERESISLYFVLALQSVPQETRAAFMFSDVMGWSREETLAVLPLDEQDLDARLEMARSVFAAEYRVEMGRREPPPESEGFSFFMKYLYQWETANAIGLVSLLAEDTVLQEVPSGAFFEGDEAIASHIAETFFEGEALRRWRLLPKRANGQMAFGVYEHNKSRRSYQAHSIQVPHFEDEAVSEIISFGFPRLFPVFGLLPEVAEQG